ncbi:mRNA turnover and ribosome assembly protein [Batrachochytrium dendrobatidis]
MTGPEAGKIFGLLNIFSYGTGIGMPKIVQGLNVQHSISNVLKCYLTSFRIFLGRNRVMAKALGTTEESEYKLNLRELSLKLVGDVGLLFTNSTPEEVKKYFEGKKNPTMLEVARLLKARSSFPKASTSQDSTALEI